MAKKNRQEERQASIDNISIKTRREPAGGLSELQKIVEKGIKKIEAILVVYASTPKAVSVQKHNKLIGFLICFLYTDMPQVYIITHAFWFNVNNNPLLQIFRAAYPE